MNGNKTINGAILEEEIIFNSSEKEFVFTNEQLKKLIGEEKFKEILEDLSKVKPKMPKIKEICKNNIDISEILKSKKSNV